MVERMTMLMTNLQRESALATNSFCSFKNPFTKLISFERSSFPAENIGSSCSKANRNAPVDSDFLCYSYFLCGSSLVTSNALPSIRYLPPRMSLRPIRLTSKPPLSKSTNARSRVSIDAYRTISWPQLV